MAVGFVVSGVFGVDAAPGTSAAADAVCPVDVGAEDVTAAVAAVVVVASPSDAAAVALCNALSTSATSCAACAATGNAPVVSPRLGCTPVLAEVGALDVLDVVSTWTGASVFD